MIVIKSANASAIISTRGGELVSLQKDGKELLWQGDEASWKGHAPILFPVCGGLKNDAYLLNGKSYPMPKHGFARKSEFCVALQTENAVTLGLCEPTREEYPFFYTFSVTYTLMDEVLTVETRVENRGEDTVYFALGAHEGYNLEGELSDYSVLFEREESFDAHILEDSLLTGKTVNLGHGVEFPLSDSLFSEDAVVFDTLHSREVSLLYRKKNVLSVSFPSFSRLLLWTVPPAKFLCIEPWTCLPDRKDFHGEISEKPDICALGAGEKRNFIHTIKF